jgi:hypothetical protein
VEILVTLLIIVQTGFGRSIFGIVDGSPRASRCRPTKPTARSS